MDLDDSFTAKIIRRTENRKEYLNMLKTESASVGMKRAVLIDEHQVHSDEPPNKSPKLQKTQTLQSAYISNDKENFEMTSEEDSNAAFVPFHSASKVRGLSALKNNFSRGETADFSSASNSQIEVNKNNTYVFSTNSREMCSGKKTRLADLAADINQWEDDTHHKPTLSSNNVASSEFPPSCPPTDTPKPNTFSMKLYYSNKHPENSQNGPHPPFENPDCGMGSLSSCNQGNIKGVSVGGRAQKAQAWDKAVSATLECNNKSESNYLPLKQAGKELKSADLTKPKDGKNIVPSSAVPVSTPSNVDPAGLPLSARKALFEKALLSGTPKLNDSIVDHSLSVAQRAAMFENASKVNTKPKTANFKEPKTLAPKICEKNINASPVKTVPPTEINTGIIKASPAKKVISSPLKPITSPAKTVGNHTRFIQQKLFENSSTNWQEKEIVAKSTEERKKEISSLVNRWEKLSSSSAENGSDVDKNPLLSEEGPLCHSAQLTSQENEMMIARNDAENLSNEADDLNEESESSCEEAEDFIEDENLNQETEDINYETDDLNYEAEDLNYEGKTYVPGGDPTVDENVFYSPVTANVNSQPAEVKSIIDDERARSSASSQDTGSIMSSLSCSEVSYTDESSYNASRSQSCSSGSSVGSYNVPNSSVNQEDSENRKKEKNPDVPLLYTVSFYRKQKQETRLTPPMKTIVRREKVTSPESSDSDYTELIQERIKALQEEILRQQTVISQTSQALNLCSATAEFSGSTEQVEGERLLLIATQKRQACLNEITRLKTFGAKGGNVADGKGTLTISDLQLPLKREFIASQLEGKGSDTVHYFLCLIRHGAQVMVTQMMSTDDKTSDGSLCFTNHIQVRDLPADFSIIFEVYALQTKKEVLPHEKKYHIKREHSKIRLTPKGKKSDGKLLLPAVSSPGGPNAVRSPSFGVVGFTRFTLHNCNKRIFTLDKVPFASPLDGVLRVQLQLHAEHKVMEKGFLTFFEDVSGFGAWHRRWCALDATRLIYWKYPDDEHKREPIGTLDLKQCITSQVKQVPRDVCARPHTFQLVIVRPQEKGDKNTLISRSINTLTTTKHLLSADTKEERILWCNKLNEALSNVRKWNPQALRPVEGMQDW